MVLGIHTAGPIDPQRACAACENKPNHSEYVMPGADATVSSEFCSWRCLPGYYARAGITDGCEECTPATSENCRPGFKLEVCSELLERDTSCSAPCNADEHGKPDDGDETSEWVWTTFAEDGTGTIVQNQQGGVDGRPNIGCMWRCKEGFVLRELDSGVSDLTEVVVSSTQQKQMLLKRKMLSFCVRDDSFI